ncbi:MAG: glycosyltransferase family 4 protein [Cyanobacteria bacterium CRU_2_1]|nr:glycosyltransferase family 4 protein [Cyanobacteria bacterium CRU_2_1]
MESCKNILVITPTPSHPQNSGNRKRVHSLFKYFQSHSFNIHFVLYNAYQNDAICNKSNYEEMRQEWDYFDLVMPSPDYHKVLTTFRNRLCKRSLYQQMASKGLTINFGIDDWCSDSLINFIKWKTRNYAFSAVFIEYVFLSKVAEYIPRNTLKIIDTHDVFANRHNTLVRNGMEASFFSTSKTSEIKGLNRSDLVLAIQEEEKRYFESHLASKVIKVSHIEQEKFVDKEYQTLHSIGIISSLNSINVISIQKFIDLISRSQSLNDLKIYIAGSVCQKISVSLPNVILLNHVDSLANFYALADLYINPMVTGTGIKIKTLEAFSYGVPFLSTQSGSVGISSSFDFHNFLGLEELVEHLEHIYVKNILLKSYQDASKQCFYDYKTKLDSQLELLLSYVEGC